MAQASAGIHAPAALAGDVPYRQPAVTPRLPKIVDLLLETLVAASKTLTPEQRSARARRAAAVRHSLDTTVQQIVDRAPELTQEQASKLLAVLDGVR